MEGKEYEELVEASQKVYEKGKDKGDFVTAGHGKHTQGDTLMKLRRIKEAVESYREAEKMYSEVGSDFNIDFHLDLVRKKITVIEEKIDISKLG